ncbi:MAG: DoxX family protein [Gammaproteobacteria bacterium]|nr:DoxX family protein [Gammaproteobacteria bacterium]
MKYLGGLRGLGVTLGFGLVLLGGAKLNGIEATTAPLNALGVPPSLIPFIAWGEITIGLLLTQVRLHRLAGFALAGWMLAALGAHVLAGDWLGATLPLALLALGVVLSLRTPDVNWSRAWPAPLDPLPRDRRRQLFFVVRHVGVAFLFRWAVGGLLFWSALPLLALSHARRLSMASHRERLEHVVMYLLFYGYGVGGIWNFVGHFFMADFVAGSVGWTAGSPFQQELAFYALGTGVVALLTPWWKDRYWVAAAVAPSIFIYGAAFTHIEDYLVSGNVAPMNWSISAVGANLVIPTVVLGVTWAYARAGGFVTPREG